MLYRRQSCRPTDGNVATSLQSCKKHHVNVILFQYATHSVLILTKVIVVMTSTVYEACTVINKMSDGTITTEWAIQKVSHTREKHRLSLTPSQRQRSDCACSSRRLSLTIRHGSRSFDVIAVNITTICILKYRTGLQAWYQLTLCFKWAQSSFTSGERTS